LGVEESGCFYFAVFYINKLFLNNKCIIDLHKIVALT